MSMRMCLSAGRAVTGYTCQSVCHASRMVTHSGQPSPGLSLNQQIRQSDRCRQVSGAQRGVFMFTVIGARGGGSVFFVGCLGSGLSRVGS